MWLNHLKALIRPLVYKKLHREAILTDMQRYNMVTGAGEDYYFEQYMQMMSPVLGETLDGKSILDLGCGQGRFAVPLAKMGGRVCGVDFSRDALAFAETYARENGVRDSIQFLRLPFDKFIERNRETFDYVLCIEALYMDPGYLDTLAAMPRLLNPGGIAMLCLRPKLYDVLDKLYHRDFAGAQAVYESKSAAERPYRLKSFNSHTSSEARQLIESVGLNIQAFFGIGALSGIEDDPLSAICHPDRVSDSDINILQDLEISIGKHFFDYCRYFLIIAEKT